MLVIHYKHLDEITSTITVDMKKQTVRVADYTDNVIDCAWGNYAKNHILTIDDFYAFLRNRLIPKNRYDSKEVFSYILGREVHKIDETTILEAVKKTHGCMANDFYSLEFVELKVFDGTDNTFVSVKYQKDTDNPLSNGFVPCKGDTIKYKVVNTWYKEDYFGYEAACSYLCSKLLYTARKADGSRVDYIPYTIREIDGKIYSVSEDFLEEWKELYTLEDLYMRIRGCRLYDNLSITDKTDCIIEFMEKELNITDAGCCITLLIEWDALTLHPLRAMDDIYIIRDEDMFYPAPVFGFNKTWFYSIGKSKNMQYDMLLNHLHKKYGRQLYLDTDSLFPDIFDEIKQYYNHAIADKLKFLYKMQFSVN